MNQQSIKNYSFSILISLVILIPHFIWLLENDFVTIFYGLNRSGISDFNLINHFKKENANFIQNLLQIVFVIKYISLELLPICTLMKSYLVQLPLGHSSRGHLGSVGVDITGVKAVLFLWVILIEFCNLLHGLHGCCPVPSINFA